ncbi:hypothetical protein HG531_014095 [Fusarium graminearum]|nr:hypothetical protein HG531_014095 [Fusarium graminearum]
MRNAISQSVLQLSNLGHHGQRVLRLLRHVSRELFVLLPQPLDLLFEFDYLRVGRIARTTLALHTCLLAVVLIGQDHIGGRSVSSSVRVCVNTAKMLVQVLQS